MCGRIALIADFSELKARFKADGISSHPRDSVVPPRARYNIAPQSWVPVVTADPTHRTLHWMKWGLVPRWVKPEEAAAFSAHTANARSETAATKPSFKHALATGRCIVPITAFYEWKTEIPEPAQLGLFGAAEMPPRGKPIKQPYRIFVPTEPIVGLAGLSEHGTFSLLTRDADPQMTPVHDRMPILLTPDLEDTWLDPSLKTVEAANARLQELAHRNPPRLQLVPANPRLNRAGEEGKELWETTNSGT